MMNVINLQGRKAGLITASLTLGLALFASDVHAQAQPAPPVDAGRILRDELPDPGRAVMPGARPAPVIPRVGEESARAAPGGFEVTIQRIDLVGNTVFPTDRLLALLGAFADESFDLAGLEGLARRITDFYRDNGYPFATAFLPPQRVDDASLTIEIVEGRYGQVRATDDEAIARQADAYLGVLQPGSPIETGPLERAMLILSDLPGVEVGPLLRPGEEVGTADLDVEISTTRRWNAGIRFDNHGGRFSGEHRGHLDFSVNRLLFLGDELSFRGLYSERDLFLGTVRYEMPLGYRGLRGFGSYTRTTYELGADFSGFAGLANVYSGGLLHPFMRSQSANITGLVTLEYRDLDDRLNGTSYDRKGVLSLTPSMRFDFRDDVFGGGVTFGSVGFTFGHLNSDDDSSVRGDFSRVSGQVARLQSLPAWGPSSGQSSLFGSLAFQTGLTRLNSSEHFSLGGPGAVRAYPAGEAGGSSGLVTQLELRHTIGAFTPFAFYDYGLIAGEGGTAEREISGAGVGIRVQHLGFNADLSVAWRLSGGDSRSDSVQRDPRIWFSAGYRF